MDDRGYEVVFERVDDALANEICAFWMDNQALTDSQEARRRTAEVVCVARNAASEIVGVNSVYVSGLNHPAQPYYFYRIFVRKTDRVLGLSTRMRHLCVEHLRVKGVER